MKTGGRGGWKPFLHHISKGRPYRGRAISLKAPKKLPRADYLHEEYGGIDSDHVFVIWAEPKGHAWSYQAAYDLVLRLRARTGIAFDPHWFRHFLSAATR